MQNALPLLPTVADIIIVCTLWFNIYFSLRQVVMNFSSKKKQTNINNEILDCKAL